MKLLFDEQLRVVGRVLDDRLDVDVDGVGHLFVYGNRVPFLLDRTTDVFRRIVRVYKAQLADLMRNRAGGRVYRRRVGHIGGQRHRPGAC